MRRMSHYLGFYTEILSTKVWIKRSGLIEEITIVQVYDHPIPTGESNRFNSDKVRLDVVNILEVRAGLSAFTRLTNRLWLLLAGLQVFSIIVCWLDSQGYQQRYLHSYKSFITNLQYLFRAVHQWISTGLSLGR